MKFETDRCWIVGCSNEINEPEYCCSGKECGCMGLPISPPYCETCFDIIKPFDDGNRQRIDLLESGQLDNVIVIKSEEW